MKKATTGTCARTCTALTMITVLVLAGCSAPVREVSSSDKPKTETAGAEPSPTPTTPTPAGAQPEPVAAPVPSGPPPIQTSKITLGGRRIGPEKYFKDGSTTTEIRSPRVLHNVEITLPNGDVKTLKSEFTQYFLVFGHVRQVSMTLNFPTEAEAMAHAESMIAMFPLARDAWEKAKVDHARPTSREYMTQGGNPAGITMRVTKGAPSSFWMSVGISGKDPAMVASIRQDIAVISDEPTFVLEDSGGHTFSPNSKWLAVKVKGGIRILEAPDFQEAEFMRGVHTNQMVFGDDGLLGLRGQQEATIWDLNRKRKVRSAGRRRPDILGELSSDLKHVIVQGDSQSFHVLNLETNKYVASWTREEVRDVEFTWGERDLILFRPQNNKDGFRLASLSSGRFGPTLAGTSLGQYKWSVSGDRIYGMKSNKGEILVWDPRDGQLIETITIMPSRTFAASATTGRIAAVVEGGALPAIFLYDMKGKPVNMLTTPGKDLDQVDFSPDGRYLIAEEGYGDNQYLYDLQALKTALPTY